MARYIRLCFSDENLAVKARLLDEKAPKTCQIIWDALPLTSFCQHAVYSGSEIYLPIPPKIRVEREYATINMAPGDVVYGWFEGGHYYGFPDDFAEIAWFYDRDAQPRMADGPVPLNIFATIQGDAIEFYALCRRMRREGQKAFAITRMEQ